MVLFRLFKDDRKKLAWQVVEIRNPKFRRSNFFRKLDCRNFGGNEKIPFREMMALLLKGQEQSLCGSTVPGAGISSYRSAI